MASGNRIIFSVPKPPSSQQILEDPDATLAWIKARIHELITAIRVQTGVEPVIDYGAYSVMHTFTHDYCSASHGINAEKLYRALEELLLQHCREIRAEILETVPDASGHDISIARTYVEKWTQYSALARLNAHLFAFLERHWIRREFGESRIGICSILDLHMTVWRQEVLTTDVLQSRSPPSGENHPDAILAALTRLDEWGASGSTRECVWNILELLNEVSRCFGEVSLELANG